MSVRKHTNTVLFLADLMMITQRSVIVTQVTMLPLPLNINTNDFFTRVLHGTSSECKR